MTKDNLEKIVRVFVTKSIDGKRHYLAVKENSEFYSLPGGRIKDGETPEQAVKREVDEELGINSLDLNKIKDANFDYIDIEHKGVRYRIYFFRGKLNQTPRNMDNIRYKWLPIRRMVDRDQIPSTLKLYQILKGYGEV